MQVMNLVKREHKVHVLQEQSECKLNFLQKWWNWWKGKLGRKFPSLYKFFSSGQHTYCGFHSIDLIHSGYVLMPGTQPYCLIPNFPTALIAKLWAKIKTLHTKTIPHVPKPDNNICLHSGISKNYDSTNGTALSMNFSLWQPKYLNMAPSRATQKSSYTPMNYFHHLLTAFYSFCLCKRIL